ncbi:MAG: hypothetical protein WCK98_01140 [bacterium]
MEINNVKSKSYAPNYESYIAKAENGNNRNILLSQIRANIPDNYSKFILSREFTVYLGKVVDVKTSLGEDPQPYKGLLETEESSRLEVFANYVWLENNEELKQQEADVEALINYTISELVSLMRAILYSNYPEQSISIVDHFELITKN